MNKRDLAIINHLEMFRVMSRNDIIDLHFSHLKNPISNANTVLKRLVRDQQIEVSKNHSPYLYFPLNHIKKDSTKIPHFLKLVDIYKQLSKYSTPEVFQIEPKYNKGLAEPDIYTVFKGTPLFIEVQRNIYSQQVMDNKIKRYEALKYSDLFRNKIFPSIIIVTNTRYVINTDDLDVIQVPSIHHLAGKNNKKNVYNNGIKIKIG